MPFSSGWDASNPYVIPKELNYYMRLGERLKVSTAENGAVFYSGPGNQAFAAMNGKTTLEMTPGGNWLDEEALFNNPLLSRE